VLCCSHKSFKAVHGVKVSSLTLFKLNVWRGVLQTKRCVVHHAWIPSPSLGIRMMMMMMIWQARSMSVSVCRTCGGG
jgi:hypothetical protein